MDMSVLARILLTHPGLLHRAYEVGPTQEIQDAILTLQPTLKPDFIKKRLPQAIKECMFYV